MSSYHPLQRHWRNGLSQLLSSARHDVLISSPFVTARGVEFLNRHLAPKFKAVGRLSFLTDLSPQNVIQGATDPRALQQLTDAAATVRLYHLPRLHAKVYVADDTSAIITSGNLTEGGLSVNYEYGVIIGQGRTVKVVRRDIEEYSTLGALLGLEQLSAYSTAAAEAKSAFGDQQRNVRSAARNAFEDALERANIELLKLRVVGDSVQAILSKTVLYLLRREGCLSTTEMHPLVQALHPDICDDSVDRVIDGQHFGKKWKHWVRTAQAMLKRQGKIELRDGQWHLQ